MKVLLCVRKSRLQKKLKSKEKVAVDQPVTVSAVETKAAAQGFRPKWSQRGDDRFCYKCGEDGHISTQCSSPENEKRVIRRLIASLKAKNKDDDAKGETTHCQSNKHDVQVKATAGFPEGLIGPPSTVQVKVNGHPCTAILDSGSQVTIIFEKWYEKHLSNVPIQPVSGLAIWGLSDTSYPYLGYVVVDMQFPKELVGKSESLCLH